MSRAKTLLIGGGIAATLAALLFKRDRVMALLPGGSDEPAPPPQPGGYAPPPVSNYDAPGPVANTATPVPVPPAFEPPTIDEAAEEAAAAAEAANIGGQVSDYAGPTRWRWTLTGPEERRALQVAGPNSVRIEENDS